MIKLVKEIHEMSQVVCLYTGLSIEQLNEIRYEAAYDYLAKVIGTDTYGMEHLPRTPQFWGHWNLIWHRIDEIIMYGTDDKGPSITVDMPQQQARQIYLEMHDINLKNYRLNSTLIDAAWHSFIKTLSK